MEERKDQKGLSEDNGSRVLWLMTNYFPELVKLMGSKYDWVKEDRNFEEKYRLREGVLARTQTDVYPTDMTMFDLLVKTFVYQENEIYVIIMDHINQLLGQILKDHPEFKNSLHEAFAGKFSNLNGLNYLNPFGEISYLYYQLYEQKNKVLRLEAPYPNGKPKDFLVETNNFPKGALHELVNIHSKSPEEATDEQILNHVIEKAKEKILRETKGKYEESKEPLSFVIVLWHTNVEVLRRQMNFYNRLNDTIVPEISERYPIQGFYTYVKVGNTLKFINVFELLGYE